MSAKARKRRLLDHFPSIEMGSYLWLLAALIVLLIVSPLLSSFTVFTLRISSLLSLFVLLTGILAVSRSVSATITLSVIAVLAVTVELLSHFGAGQWSVILVNVLSLSFLVGLLIIIEFDVFADRKATTETLAGSCCGYVLIAAIFASIYSIMLQYNPDGLTLWPNATITTDEIVFQGEYYGVLGYFSIVTLTTLGYGDVVPNSTAFRNTAAIEALIGQLYLAVIVARLVGINITARSLGNQTQKT